MSLVRNLCGSIGETSPNSRAHQQRSIPPNPTHPPNTMEGLVLEGWRISPAGPHEAGPSNWVDRAQEQALMICKVFWILG